MCRASLCPALSPVRSVAPRGGERHGARVRLDVAQEAPPPDRLSDLLGSGQERAAGLVEGSARLVALARGAERLGMDQPDQGLTALDRAQVLEQLERVTRC